MVAKMIITKKEMYLDICDNPYKRELARQIVNTYHTYVKFKDTPNRRIQWLIRNIDTDYIYGVIGINSATLAIGVRDKYIGWDKTARLKNVVKVANNYRYCLMGGDNVSSSGVLSLLHTESRKVWKDKYGDNLVLLETYVEPPYDGHSYLAAGWVNIGMTKGFSIQKSPIDLWKRFDDKRGRLARKDPKKCLETYCPEGKQWRVQKSTKKYILVKPLHRYWQKELRRY